jgi:hypothetical protein
MIRPVRFALTVTMRVFYVSLDHAVSTSSDAAKVLMTQFSVVHVTIHTNLLIPGRGTHIFECRLLLKVALSQVLWFAGGFYVMTAKRRIRV